MSSESSDEIKGKGKTKENEPKRKATKEPVRSEPKRRRITDYEQSVLYEEEEEYRTGESATMGMIRVALEQPVLYEEEHYTVESATMGALEQSAPEEEIIESDNELEFF